jgi:uncharacterized membrane protein YoaT (DUF817 family)
MKMHLFASLGKLTWLSISAAVFAILLLAAFVVTYQLQWPILGLHRYDALLVYALLIQWILIYWKLETPREVLVIAVFHLMAMVMELFLTSPSIGSWHYGEPGVMRIANVPLFAGFMYSAVGSFLARGLRLLDISLSNMPAMWLLGILALLSYANFFVQHFWLDSRNVLFVFSVILFFRTRMQLRLNQHTIKLHFLPVLLFLAGLVWLAENIATYNNIWRYPSQVVNWHMVGLGKLGSWYLLLTLSLVLVLAVMGRRDRQGHWTLHKA